MCRPGDGCEHARALEILAMMAASRWLMCGCWHAGVTKLPLLIIIIT
jgi:hypothetical protein